MAVGKGHNDEGSIVQSVFIFNVSNTCRFRIVPWYLLLPYTHLGDVEKIFNPLGVSLGASES
jgi:hypothetical protein